MIYFDNNATTPLHPEVKKVITESLDLFGNPSSAHQTGREVRYLIEKARDEIAEYLNCFPDELIFTASGSEANNTIIKSIAGCCGSGCSCGPSSVHVITSCIEHPSVLNTLKCMESHSVEVTYLPVDEFGMVGPESVRKAIKPNTKLITIMFANNEIGTIQPIEEIGLIAKERGITFHTDAVQAIGKVKINLNEMNIDSMSMSGHKIYAPKGIGVLYQKRSKKFICPLISGGHQENSLRAGTENTLGILAIGEAVRQLKLEADDEVKRLKTLRDRLQTGLFKQIPGIKLNGHPEKRLPGTLNISFKNIEGESILLRLDMFGMSVSTGSACSSGSLDPSHVIMALGVEPEIAHSSVRFSLGRQNTESEVDSAIELVRETVESLRKISPIKGI